MKPPPDICDKLDRLSVKPYNAVVYGNKLELEFDVYPGITYDLLSEISNVFETTKIDIGSRVTSSCDTCGDESCVTITIQPGA